MRFTVSIGYRRTRAETPGGARTDYKPSHGLYVAPDGSIGIVALGSSREASEALLEAVTALSASFDSPEALLTFLHRKDSTISPYGRPTTLTAQSPDEAVRKLAAKD